MRTRVYAGAAAFVDDLHRRWQQRQAPAVASTAFTPQRFPPPSREMPENAVFISYAREDLTAVQRLRAAMEAAGLVTWFDLETPTQFNCGGHTNEVAVARALWDVTDGPTSTDFTPGVDDGPIDTMNLTWQAPSLHMEWCLDCHRDPARYVRPPAEVFNMNWQAPGDQQQLGEELVAAHDIHRRTDCTACHR